MEEASGPPRSSLIKVGFFCCGGGLKLYVFHVFCFTVNKAKSGGRQLRRQGTVNVTVPVRRIQRNSHCSQLCPHFCPVLQPVPGPFRPRSLLLLLRQRQQQQRSRPPARSRLKATWRRLCRSAARPRDGCVPQVCLGLCGPVSSGCVTFSVCEQILRLHLW